MKNQLIRSAIQDALQQPPNRLDSSLERTKASVAAILREESLGPEMLFIHRAEHPKDPWSGHMALPGGRMDPADPDERSVAERETMEEVGLKLAESARYMGPLDEVQVRTMEEGRKPMGVSPFVYWLESPVSMELSAEVQEVCWIPFLELYERRHLKKLYYPFGDQKLVFPSIEFQGKVIWGLTLKIVADLLERLAQGKLADWLRTELSLPEGEPIFPQGQAMLWSPKALQELNDGLELKPEE